MNIQYYKMRFRLVSPLSVGSGSNANTDSDVVLDSLGRPVIPATALAGVIRHACETDGKPRNQLFGFIGPKASADSRIRFYDAEADSSSTVTVRDMVALENKVGIKGAKFDREAVETNVAFVTLFELRDVSEQDTSLFLRALSALDAGALRLGSKTARGYGQIEITSLQKAAFELPVDKASWLTFKPYDYSADACYTDFTLPSCESDFVTLHLELKQRGAVSVRSYTARSGKDIQDADYEQLTMSDGVPVIPGTSWAGAFRDRFREFAGETIEYCPLTNEVFGFVLVRNQDRIHADDAVQQQKSKILFSESRIMDSDRKVITRNAIDRFSAATQDGALYTENTAYYGKPLGLGSVKMTVESVVRRTFDPVTLEYTETADTTDYCANVLFDMEAGYFRDFMHMTDFTFLRGNPVKYPYGDDCAGKLTSTGTLSWFKANHNDGQMVKPGDTCTMGYALPRLTDQPDNLILPALLKGSDRGGNAPHSAENKLRDTGTPSQEEKVYRFEPQSKPAPATKTEKVYCKSTKKCKGVMEAVITPGFMKKEQELKCPVCGKITKGKW